MKKRIIALMLAAAMATGLVACGGGSGSKQTEAAKTEAAGGATEAAGGSTEAAGGSGEGVAVSVILKTLASEYWTFVKSGCEAYAAEHPENKIEVKGATSETAYDEQQNMIETDLGSGAYDAFVISPLQADMVATLIAGQTKPIIAVDTKIEAPEILSFVGTGNESAATGRQRGSCAPRGRLLQGG